MVKESNIMTPTSSYKMPKQIKTILNRYKDPHHRGEMKRGWIQADLESRVKPKSEKGRKFQNED